MSTTKRRRTTNYLNNANLMEQLTLSKENLKKVQEENPDATAAECATPELVKMIMMLVERYAQKANWRGYTYNDDMRGDATVSLLNGALKFNPEVSQNPFGYLTQIVTHSFLTTLDKEKRMRTIRDDMLEEQGFNPSHTRQLENESAFLTRRMREFYGGDATCFSIRGGTKIWFRPNLECWKPVSKVVTLTAEVERKTKTKTRRNNKRRVFCKVPLELLQEYFMATEEEPMTAVITGRVVLQNAAFLKIKAKEYEDDGKTIILSGEDIEAIAESLDIQ